MGEGGASLNRNVKGVFHNRLKAALSSFEKAPYKFFASDWVRYAGLFRWVVIGGKEATNYESSVVFSLVPKVPRYWSLGDLPITHPRRALVLVELHSSLCEGLTEVLETLVGYFGGHYE